MNGQKLEEVISFKYLGATLCKDGTCSAEVHIRIASAMARLNRIWWSNTISFARKFKNYRTISLISHQSKVMLKIILNRLKPQAENIIAEEQAGFRAGRRTQSRSSTYTFYVKNISSTSKTSTMSSWTSRRPSTGFGMQLCGQP